MVVQGIYDVMAGKYGAEPGAFYKEVSVVNMNIIIVPTKWHTGQLDSISPLGPKGTPLEISSLVSYLASKEAHFITGQSVSGIS